MQLQWCMVVIDLELDNESIMYILDNESIMYKRKASAIIIWRIETNIIRLHFECWFTDHKNPLMNRSNYNRECRRVSIFSVPHLLTALVINSYKADSITHTSDECGSSCLEKNVCGAQYITHVIPNYKVNYAIWHFTIRIQTYEVRTNFVLNLVMFTILLKDMV